MPLCITATKRVTILDHFGAMSTNLFYAHYFCTVLGEIKMVVYLVIQTHKKHPKKTKNRVSVSAAGRGLPDDSLTLGALVSEHGLHAAFLRFHVCLHLLVASLTFHFLRFFAQFQLCAIS